MKCSTCHNLLQSYVIILGKEINDIIITADVRIILYCSCCDKAVKETELLFEEEIDHQCTTNLEVEKFSIEPEKQFSIISIRKKKTYRTYKKSKYYGAEISFEIKCNKCDEVFIVKRYIEEEVRKFNNLIFIGELC